MCSKVTSIESLKVLAIAAFRLVPEAQKITLVRSPLWSPSAGNVSQAGRKEGLKDNSRSVISKTRAKAARSVLS